MMVQLVTLTVKVRFPWWWRIYLWGLLFYDWCGFEVHPEVAGKFITDHTRFTIETKSK